jgi:ribosomal protein L11 methyltransferase
MTAEIKNRETFRETRIFTTTAGTEAVSAMLLGFGVDGVSIEDAADIADILDNGNGVVWAGDIDSDRPQEAVVTYYTTDDEVGDELTDKVRTGLMKLKADEQYGDYGKDVDLGRLYAETKVIGDEWKTKWKENFKPFHMTDRFVVCPPWETPDSESDDGTASEVIVIDPGMAFGTGSHETTAMCAQALEEAVDASSVVLDIGTGSGILAIVAAKCGARAVTGIDIDDDALRSASENVERNSVSQTISLIRGDVTVETVRELLISANGGARFDVICANLTSGILKQLLSASTALLADGGRLILSGILEEERADMLTAIEAGGRRKVILEEVRGEWLLLCADLL